ncbi:MAG: UMP kinase [Spirochaetales bacterium]
MSTHVLSLGGSIVAPENIDIEFLKALKQRISGFLEADPQRRLIMVVGGGGPARAYQHALGQLAADAPPEQADQIGIAATRLNAELLRGVFVAYVQDPVVTDPTADFEFSGRILIGAGWKPGFSTDFDAVCLAERFSADSVINLSNIAKVYDKDPKKSPDAQPLDKLSWGDYRKMVGDTWTPGANSPFDPVAAAKAMKLGLSVIVASGRNLDTVEDILTGEPFEGTTIGPH